MQECQEAHGCAGWIRKGKTWGRSACFLLLMVGMLAGIARPAGADEGDCLAEARLLTAEQFLEQAHKAQDYLQRLDTPVIEGEKTVREREIVVRVRGKKGRSATRTVVRKETHVALSRRITLAAYDECDGSLHAVAVRVPHPLPAHAAGNGRKAVPTFVFTRLTPGYEVSHEGGMGVARLKFSVSKDGRPLTVLAMKHPRIPSRYWRSGDPQLLDDTKAVVYSAYQPEYHRRPFTEDLVEAGVRRWLGDIRGALEGLKQSGARSFAFPEESLAQLWPPEVLLMLGTIEQADDGEFRADALRTAEAIAIEYAMNSEPFYYANSSADAIGPYQFTDNWKGSRPGTYSSIVRRCSDAQLISSFDRGARDLKNSIRAAVCLLDLELARMPDDALRLFREDYQVGAAYPIAAYNAGGRQSAKLYSELPPGDLPDAAQSLDLPVKAFKYRKVVVLKKKKKRARTRTHVHVYVNNETRYYLVKMFTAWDIVEDWMVLADAAAAKPPAAEDAPSREVDPACISVAAVDQKTPCGSSAQ
ncbi:MAG: hypothetical protein H6R12_907 [Proteobacteria bacterium]|nr:hypothetical protein [Pseudomonadota bacterium]